MENLPLEKEFVHRSFCNTIEKIDDLEFLKNELSKLHLLYLSQQVVFTQMLKNTMPMPENS